MNKRLAGLLCLSVGGSCLALSSFARPPAFDLGACRETLAGYAKTEADPKAQPMAKAKAKMARLVLELRTCEDSEFDAKVAETRTFIENGGDLETADGKVEFLLSAAESGGAFPCPDVEKLAEAASAGDARARMRYVQMMVKRCRPGRNDFAYARSNDRRLAIVEAAMADPVLAKNVVDLALQRFEILRDMGRKTEAEALAREQVAAAPNDGLKRRWLMALAAACQADARRYAEKPSPELLAKAESLIEQAGALTKGGLLADDWLQIAQLRLDRDDFAGAREAVLKSRVGKPNARTLSRGDIILANAAFGAEDWSEAADRLLPLFSEKGRNDHDQTIRTVQALFAADRRSEAIPLVKWLSEESGGRYKQSRAQFARLLKELSAAPVQPDVKPAAAVAKPAGWQISAEPSHPDGVYAKGENVVFTFLATNDGQPLADWDLELTVEKPGAPLPEKLSAKTDAAGRYTLTVPAPQVPGWVLARAMTRKAPDAKGRRLPGGRFDVGAICDRDAIRPGLPPPADLKDFWDREIAELAKVPMNPKLTPVALKENDPVRDVVDAWEFELGCVGPRPATGYLAKPKKSVPKSLPAIVFFQGASGKTVWVPSYYADRAVCLIANKFGIPNGLTNAEYEREDLKKEWFGFAMRGKTSRDETFFKWLILRDLRILEFAKSQPEWNGEVLIVNGESLGGGQAVAVGALDPDVTFVCACVPALSDHNGALAGRRNGWPKLWTPGADGQPQTDEDRLVSAAARYVDTTAFCTLLTPKKEVSIGTGWIDVTCPPEGVLAAYNVIPEGVKKNLWFNPKAGHGAGNAHGGRRIKELLGK